MMASESQAVPIYGNYHGYYSKRPFTRDNRLSILPPNLLRGAAVLDVGCNEGWVTCELAQLYGAHKVVGVDIDDTLVRGAWRRRRLVWSLQFPQTADNDTQQGNVAAPSNEPKIQKINNTFTLSGSNYFPVSCECMFGAQPIPPAEPQTKAVFPHNLSFRTANWVESGIPEDADGYDVVIAFSLTKWIHLNGGDAAIMSFFRRVFSVLKPDGAFVLEPQGWDTYAKAKRMDQALKETAKGLTIRPIDFESILESIGFGPVQHLGCAGEGGFKRPVDLYRKP